MNVKVHEPFVTNVQYNNLNKLENRLKGCNNLLIIWASDIVDLF